MLARLHFLNLGGLSSFVKDITFLSLNPSCHALDAIEGVWLQLRSSVSLQC